MTNIAQVIAWKFNSQPGMSTKNGVIIEFPEGIPSQDEQDQWTREYEKFQVDTQYIRDRINVYPPIVDQLDMIYHDMKDGTTLWVAAIQAIKERYPKP